jgi:hypothetical protein
MENGVLRTARLKDHDKGGAKRLPGVDAPELVHCSYACFVWLSHCNVMVKKVLYSRFPICDILHRNIACPSRCEAMLSFLDVSSLNLGRTCCGPLFFAQTSLA